MKRTIASFSIALLLASSAVMAATKIKVSADYMSAKKPTVELATEPGTNSASVYMQLNNKGDKPAVLVAANSLVANQTQLYKSAEDEGGRDVESVKKIVIQPHATTTLQADGYQILLSGLKQALHKGDVIQVLLILEDGSSLNVKAKVS